MLAGGGSYGDPCERDPEQILEDVRQGKVTVAHAHEAYGVVIDGQPPRVDLAETERLRRNIRR